MTDTELEVLRFVQENDVKFIRLAFCDIFGNLKNISIMAEELPKAFEHGISFDASAIRGFLNVEDSDLLLYPDPGTLEVLPWRPQQGRVARFYCSIRHPDGTPFAGDLRNALKDSAQRAIEMGFRCKIGSECEFYLFETDENGAPTNIPFDNAGYLDVAPMDKGENVRREICLTLEEMGIRPDDVLLRADGQALGSIDDLMAVRRTHLVGDSITLTVLRDGQTFDVDVPLYASAD